MRHRKAGKRLGRTHEHRSAMFKNMARSLLTHERIRTTETKAKELRKVVDKLITLALSNDLHARRQAYKVLGNHRLVQRLFEEIGPRFVGGGGGYTRVVRLAEPRPGDCAPMAVIELTRKEGEQVREKAEEEAPKKAAKAPVKKAAAKKEAAKKDESEKTAAPKKKVSAKTAEKAEDKEEEAKPKKKAASKPKAEKKMEEPKAESKAEESAEGDSEK